MLRRSVKFFERPKGGALPFGPKERAPKELLASGPKGSDFFLPNNLGGALLASPASHTKIDRNFQACPIKYNIFNRACLPRNKEGVGTRLLNMLF